MARLAAGRTTQLSAEEIAAELLRLFDESDGEPSIRTLATSLGVSPRAIYHYYETRDELVVAAMGLVWEEATAEIAQTVADPVHDPGDPFEFFVIAGVATRRAFGRHRRLAMNLTLPSGPSGRLSGALAILGSAFEQLGLSGERAGLAMYTYATYVLGAIMLDASRWTNQRAIEQRRAAVRDDPRALLPEDAPAIGDDTFAAIDHVMSGGGHDLAAEEVRFAEGLRAVLRGLVADAR